MKILSLLILFFALTSFSLKADVVRVAFGERLPPFVIPESHSGIEIDIVREALAISGHEFIPQYYPMARIAISFKSRKVDVVMMDVGEDMSVFGGHYGDPPVIYDNVFITLKESNITIKKPDDLKNLMVNSFIGAQKRYPKWLGPLSAEKYSEKNDQSVQPLVLEMKRYDVVLCDKNIFKYYFKLAQKSPRFKGLPVVEHSFTVENPDDYRPVFYDKKIRDDFNLGLKTLQKNGRIKAIYDKYLK